MCVFVAVVVAVVVVAVVVVLCFDYFDGVVLPPTALRLVGVGWWLVLVCCWCFCLLITNRVNVVVVVTGAVVVWLTIVYLLLRVDSRRVFSSFFLFLRSYQYQV